MSVRVHVLVDFQSCLWCECCVCMICAVLYVIWCGGDAVALADLPVYSLSPTLCCHPLVRLLLN